VHPAVEESTAYSASTYPYWERKKNCTALAACSSVKLCGSVGLSDSLPSAVAVNVRVAWLMARVDSMASLPDAERSGVL